ncbi:response regulator [Flectobacillus roseus]|jgi:DNA-binding NarL/FixJ family response regulator|uniref:response regulator n=1 Tax=Flectobacillus roseus TaxID=502259 RepID=UPI0024B63D59|nr:response regulator transcription factor [Flectobacillus roseus]MDI9871670.1 response regulator transcription factor [Flectobacillus roseus]
MKTKVVIVDDHSLFNDGLSLILKESGKYEILAQIYDSRKAYNECNTLLPELILVDYNMPFLDGLSLVKQLRTLVHRSKIVVISMYADRREIEAFKAFEIEGYLSKTSPSAEILLSLEKIIKGENVFQVKQEQKTSFEKDFFSLKKLLTKREVEILKALKKGYTSEQVAQELCLSYYTVETHRKNINQKLKFNSKKEFYEFLDTIELEEK